MSLDSHVPDPIDRIPTARDGDFDALVAVLDPDVVLRVDGGTTLPAASMAIRGAAAVAKQAGRGLRSWLASPAIRLLPILVNAAAGVFVIVRGQPMTVIGFTVAGGKIIEIDTIDLSRDVETWDQVHA